MTPRERKAAAEVMASDGPWEMRTVGRDEWETVTNPIWNWGVSEYRVKPKPLVRYVIIPSLEYGFLTAKAAKELWGATGPRLACVRIEFLPGQFDE